MTDGVEVLIDEQLAVPEHRSEQVARCVCLGNSVLVSVGEPAVLILGDDTHAFLGLLAGGVGAAVSSRVLVHEGFLPINDAMGHFQSEPKRVPGDILIGKGAKAKNDVAGCIALLFQAAANLIELLIGDGISGDEADMWVQDRIAESARVQPHYLRRRECRRGSRSPVE